MQIESDLECTSGVHINCYNTCDFFWLSKSTSYAHKYILNIVLILYFFVVVLGYSGSTCEVVANACLKNPCPDTARCHSMVTDFICMCPMGRQIVGRSCRKYL